MCSWFWGQSSAMKFFAWHALSIYCSTSCSTLILQKPVILTTYLWIQQCWFTSPVIFLVIFNRSWMPFHLQYKPLRRMKIWILDCSDFQGNRSIIDELCMDKSRIMRMLPRAPSARERVSLFWFQLNAECKSNLITVTVLLNLSITLQRFSKCVQL